MTNTFEHFQKKERALNIALNKVKSKLEYLNTESEKLPGSSVGIPMFKYWNNWHDLQYRIEKRLWDNWSDWKDFNWNQNQFNTYP